MEESLTWFFISSVGAVASPSHNSVVYGGGDIFSGFILDEDVAGKSIPLPKKKTPFSIHAIRILH